MTTVFWLEKGSEGDREEGLNPLPPFGHTGSSSVAENSRGGRDGERGSRGADGEFSSVEPHGREPVAGPGWGVKAGSWGGGGSEHQGILAWHREPAWQAAAAS